jgi:hypothetical protein
MFVLKSHFPLSNALFSRRIYLHITIIRFAFFELTNNEHSWCFTLHNKINRLKKKVVDGSYLHNSFVPRQDFENKTIWKENYLERSMKATCESIKNMVIISIKQNWSDIIKVVPQKWIVNASNFCVKLHYEAL